MASPDTSETPEKESTSSAPEANKDKTVTSASSKNEEFVDEEEEAAAPAGDDSDVVPDGPIINMGAVAAKLKAKGAGVFNAAEVARILKEKVIGQDAVADQVTAQIQQRLAMFELAKKKNAKIEKPIGVFLLAGPPGVGKTYFCKVLADHMYDGKGKLEPIDMTQLNGAHTVSSLVGSAPGIQGGSGRLTNALIQNPKLIVLLDEFEKAHGDVQKVFLTAWNDGFITDAKTGKRVSTTQAIFMITSNAAMERLVEIEETFKDDPDGRDMAVIEALKQANYAPEVLSRIDYVFVFRQLDQEGMARLAVVEIKSLAKKYALDVKMIDEDYLVGLITNGKAFEGGGARQLGRILERQLGPQMLQLQIDGAEFIRIAQIDGKAVVRKLRKKGE